jgi:hypothetical protein
MFEDIFKTIAKSAGDGGKFAESLKEDTSAGRDFTASLKEYPNAGKDFAESLKESSSETTERRLPKNGGDWTGEPGNSEWKPDRDKVPENQKTNPDGLTWGEILDKYNIDGIPFEDGEPDFSELSKGTVEIEDYSENRDDNFDAADEKLSEQRGCTKEEVRQWRKENHYTWHERSDMKTMEKVPTEVHGNIPHEGGIAAKKKENGNG